MTERRRLPEQVASHTYRRQASEGSPSMRRRTASAQRRERPEVRRTLERVVTIPDADPSSAWNTFAQRQEQRRRVRARPQKYIETVSRTYAQTGMRATSGRMKAIRRRSMPLYQSPIPTRSGSRGARRGFLWKLLSSFAVVIILLLAVNFALTSNAFRIEQVSVVGTHNDALIQAIQRMGMQGQNIFLLNVALLTERVQALPVVSSANLSKQWPNQLIVNVTERIPVLLWHTSKGTFSIDAHGAVIAPASDTADAGHLAMVVDSTRQSANLRPGMNLRQADVAFAIEIFKDLPSVMGGTAFTLQYDGTMYASTSYRPGEVVGKGSYIVESQAGWRAYLGGADDTNSLSNRLSELQQILIMAHKQQITIATIDLRYGLRPVYTVKQ